LIEAKKSFSFSFLLILDEGGLREGWVKSAYSSLAATDDGTAKRRRIGGRRVPPARTGIITKTVARQNGGKTAAKRR
jgi:hypothetical protein